MKRKVSLFLGFLALFGLIGCWNSAEAPIVKDTNSVKIYVQADAAPSIWVWQIDGLSCSEEMGYTWDTQPTMSSSTDLKSDTGWYVFKIDEDYYADGENFSFILNQGDTVETTKSDTFWYSSDGVFYDSEPDPILYGSLAVTYSVSGFTSGTSVGATVSVTGQYISDTNFPSTDVTDLSDSSETCTFEEVPTGNNRIVTVEAVEEGSTHTKMGSILLRAITDIEEKNDNTVSVNWDTTALGNVFYYLNNTGYDISKISDADITAIKAVFPSDTHALLIDSEQIASDYDDDGVEGLQSAAAYTLTKGSVSFSFDDTYLSVTDCTATVSDPFSEEITSTNGSGTITGVAPGTWYLSIVADDGTICTRQVTVVSDTDTLLDSIVILGTMHPVSGTYSPVVEAGWDTASWDTGSIVNGSDVTFGLYSANATKILLEIYTAASGTDATYEYWMQQGIDDVWRAEIKGIGEDTYYAFRCWGPNWTYDDDWARGNSAEGFISDCDSDGNRFNPNKVVFDPRARELSHDISNPTVLGTKDAGMYGTGSDIYNGVTRRNFDTGKYVSKGIVVDDVDFIGTKPEIAAEDAIIYEAQVRGLTKHASVTSLATILSGIDGFSEVVSIPESKQGTYAGAALMAPYLKALGINTIELMPIQETDNDANGDTEAGGNFWGYMTFGFFAPDRRYSSDQSAGGPTDEFKDMVQAFHAEGIEVYMDVVYNHSGEGGVWSSTSTEEANISFMRGIDNSTYYCLCGDDNEYYWETSGCGNNLQCDNTEVRDFIVDSLTYWIDIMGVDGFRFDLASILGRVKSGTNWVWSSSATTLTKIATLAAVSKIEVIAEPWDMGDNGYHVTDFTDGWSVWNGKYRDNIRDYINKGSSSSSSKYFDGDPLSYNADSSGSPADTVNFVCAHDGFTLADLVSYKGAGNALNSTLAWPFGPSDGGNGDTNSPYSTSETWRRQAVRNFMTFQMFSRGIPMIVYGDELGRTQNGNNNSYNIDSVCNWNNYDMIDTDAPQAVTTGTSGAGYDNRLGTFDNSGSVNGNFMFFSHIANVRQNEPALTEPNYDVDIDYCKPDGTTEIVSTDDSIWIKINGSSVTDGSDYLIFSNMDSAACDFTIPAAGTGKKWVCIVNTDTDSEGNYNYWDDADATTASYTVATTCTVSTWSIVVLKLI